MAISLQGWKKDNKCWKIKEQMLRGKLWTWNEREVIVFSSSFETLFALEITSANAIT